MKKDIHQYIEKILRLLIERLPDSNPYHKFWINPKTGKLSLDIFIDDYVQPIDFDGDEDDAETPESLADAIFLELRTAGHKL